MPKTGTKAKAKPRKKTATKTAPKKAQPRIIKRGNLHIMVKSRPRREPEREHRITYEAVVDAYDEQERAMGWYYYLEGKLNFPFTARCTEPRAISPLRKGNKVEVVEMAPEDECMREV